MSRDPLLPELGRRRRRVGRVVRAVGLTVLALVAIGVILRLTVFDLVNGGGRDTWPELGTDTWMLVNRRATIERGDLVVFSANDKFYVRRVIGLPGETLSIIDAHPQIAGHETKLDELGQVTIENRPYRLLRETIDGKSWRVLDDTFRTMSAIKDKAVGDGYYLLADNREHGEDSRHLIGIIPRDRIRGVVIWQITSGSFPY
jgi:signal peptidase I